MRWNITWLRRFLGALVAAHAAGAARAEVAAPPPAAPAMTGTALAQQGYAAQMAGDARGAAAKFLAALEAGGLSAEQERVICLGLSDTLMSLGHAKEAAGLLCLRRMEPTFDVLTRLAYAQDAAGDRAASAKSYAAAAALAATPPDRARMRNGQVLALSASGDKAGAVAVARTLAGDPHLSQMDALNLAYLALQVKDDRLADQLFAQADRLKPLTGTVSVDAGYAAKRLGHDDAAVRYFRQGLNATVFGQSQSQAEVTTFNDNVRREISELSRRGGATASIFYDSSDRQTARLPGAGRGNLQLGVDAYWRPLGSNAGRPVEVFARAFQSLSSRQGDPVGWETTQGWVGVRVKPIATQNLVVEGSRMVKLGALSRNDWMVRASYSTTHGMDWPADRRPVFQAFVDAAQLLEGGETFLTADAKLGLNFSSGQSRTILAPFVGVFGGYDSSLIREVAISAGPGLWLRRYFREDAVHAPRSYVDVSVQYRVRLAGDLRAHGLFASLSVTY